MMGKHQALGSAQEGVKERVGGFLFCVLGNSMMPEYRGNDRPVEHSTNRTPLENAVQSNAFVSWRTIEPPNYRTLLLELPNHRTLLGLSRTAERLLGW